MRILNINQYDNADQMLEAFADAIHISWMVAHEAMYVQDWRHRWNRLAAEISGMQSTMIYVIGGGPAYEYINENLCLLRRIAEKHALAWEHLPFK